MITLPQTTPYLCWYDDSPKITQAAKIRAAADAYTKRFNAPPTVALVSPQEIVDVPGLIVRGEGRIGKNLVQVGRE